jgi:TonB family protein
MRNNPPRMSSAIPAHVHVVAIALFSVATSFAQSTPAEIAKAKALAVYAPRPAYPYEARSKHLTGSGIVLLNVDPSSGNATSAQLLKSTGHKILDDSALEAFRQWRFKPGSVRKVGIPINFTMQGFRDYVRTKDIVCGYTMPPIGSCQNIRAKRVIKV